MIVGEMRMWVRKISISSSNGRGGGIRLTFILTLEISEGYKLPIGTICSAATGGDTVIKYSLLDSISSHLLELAILLPYYL